MTNKREFQISLLVLGVFLLGLLTRTTNHVPNFTAIGAIALFSGMWFSNKKFAFLLPMALLFVSDIFLGFHNTMPFVYGSYLLIISIGILLKNRKNPVYILGGSLAGSILFYLITNFGVWMTGMTTATSLMQCYVDGIPFFRNMMAGDLFFNAVLYITAILVFEKIHIAEKVNEK